MQVLVKNYRGAAEAALTLDPIALVCGHNHAGKSSIAQAVAGALTRNPAVLDGVTKSAAGQLLRDGEKRGKCTVGDEAGSVTANWPGASVSESGNAPQASPIACGLTSIVDMKAKDAAATLIRVIDAHPTLEHLKAAVAGAGVPDDLLQQIWQVVSNDGWDAAHKRATERGAKMKGMWEGATGEAWGAKKADGWAPAGLDPAAMPALADLEAEVASRQQQLEQAIANQAASGERVKQLQDAVAAGRQAAADLDAVRATIEEENGLLDSITADLNALPRPEVAENMVPCPHCGGHLVVVSRTEVRAPSGGVSEQENAARQQAIQVKQAEASKVRTLLSDLRTQEAQLRGIVSAAQRAETDLAALPAGSVTAEEVADRRAMLEDAQRMLSRAQAVQRAAAIHTDIKQNLAIVEALAPNGLRQTVLTERMGAFNGALATLSTAADWPAVQVGEDMAVTFGGRAYLLLSASEQFRCRVTLQVAMASMDGSDAVIVDAADILDRTGRNALFALLQSSGLLSLVCMTMNRVEDVPDLRAAGIGRSYWIADAVLAPCGGA